MDTSPGSHYAVARCLPRLNSAEQCSGIREPFRLMLFCHTGRGAFAGSGAVEDDLLVAGQELRPSLEVVQRHCPLEVIAVELFLTVVGTHQQCVLPRHMLLRCPGVDARSPSRSV